MEILFSNAVVWLAYSKSVLWMCGFIEFWINIVGTVYFISFLKFLQCCVGFCHITGISHNYTLGRDGAPVLVPPRPGGGWRLSCGLGGLGQVPRRPGRDPWADGDRVCVLQLPQQGDHVSRVHQAALHRRRRPAGSPLPVLLFVHLPAPSASTTPDSVGPGTQRGK